MKFATIVGCALLALAETAQALHKDKVPNFRNALYRAPPSGGKPPNSTAQARHGFFQQWIDHDNHALGKFSQFYYWDDAFYKGPGSPVVFFTPGEVNATTYWTYLTEQRISGVIAKEIGAAVVVLEHRYWGLSSPYAELSTENLQFLTLENAIADLNHFALTAKLPFDESGASNADKAPWLLLGGSYSGALTAWTEAKSTPSVMWAYYASSAVVEAIGPFWRYFYPETVYMPQNCSVDISRVVEYLDDVYATGSLHKQLEMKRMFGFQNLPNYDDFMAALVNGPYLWQGNQFYENAGFFDFCDFVEGVTNKTKKLPGASGVGLQRALAGYAKWTKEVLLPGYCASYGYFTGNMSVACFDTYDKNSPIFTDMTVSNTVDRAWTWFLCNQPFGYWQVGAPKRQQTIVSRLVDIKYWTRQCGNFFPTQNGYTYGLRKGLTYDDVNVYTGGWSSRNSTRLLYVNGQFDPWRESTVSSSVRPGGPAESTPAQPIYVVPGGYHVSDFVTENGKVNADVASIQADVIRTLKGWIDEYPGKLKSNLDS